MDKQTLRETVWTTLEEEGLARFPFPPTGRIPNFADSAAAAERLTGTDAWAATTVLKANPDSPQRHVRARALRSGRTVYQAVPRLAAPEPFLALDPAAIADPDAAATLSGADEHGVPVGPAELPTLDTVVVGSVAVDEHGGRVGKGEGFSDLEFAVLAELGAVGPETVVATTVHEVQVRPEPVPHEPHDVPLDLVVTPERVVRTGTGHDRPTGLDHTLLEPADYEAMPVLRTLRPGD